MAVLRSGGDGLQTAGLTLGDAQPLRHLLQCVEGLDGGHPKGEALFEALVAWTA